MTLLGSKEVKGFDIKKYSQKKANFDKNEEEDENNEEEEKEEKEEEKADLDENLLHGQDEDIDPDAIIEENEDVQEQEEEEQQVQQILKEEDIQLVPES